MLRRLALPVACLALTACSASRRDTAEPANSAPAAPAVDALATRTDLHLHLSMDRAAKPIFKGRSGDGWLADSPQVILRNQTDVDTLVKSNVRLVLGAVWPPARIRPGRTERDEALTQLLLLRSFARQTRGFAIASSSEEARTLLSRGFVTVLPAVEGGEGLHEVADVDAYFAAGARVITLMHFVSNKLGGAAYGQLGKALGITPEKLSDEGLSEHGRAVVRRMIELGIVIDLAHASDRTMRDVLDIAEAAGVPVINTHAAARVFAGAERNLSDELAVRIVKSGGILGVTIFDGFVHGVPPGHTIADHVPGTCDDAAAHWLHFAKLVGAENVTLGSDFNGFVTRGARGGGCPNGLRHTGDLVDFYALLQKQGIPQAALDGGGERLLEVLQRVEAKANPDARARAERLRVPEADLFASPL